MPPRLEKPPLIFFCVSSSIFEDLRDAGNEAIEVRLRHDDDAVAVAQHDVAAAHGHASRDHRKANPTRSAPDAWSSA